ncbi:hypothetical protein GCM10011382_04700 [Vreelandella lutescens]|uniref:Uncharacterized protein n=1 Tax=Vreelandella lutescens TaxID=1602943 RepID=A0ABQ1NI33_9GAMM|nr:hypothetical protein GCM10011382_04700 [Halomonas lutescens]
MNGVEASNLMDTDMNATMNCADCGAKLPDEWVGFAERGPCPVCGSRLKRLTSVSWKKRGWSFMTA